MARQTGEVAHAAVLLWAQMATKIIAIVGEGGFNALYARSIRLAHARFPWLMLCSQSPKADPKFAELKTILEGQPASQAEEANILLLITFTDILSSLIGEQLTISILRSAWGHDILDVAGKGLENES